MKAGKFMAIIAVVAVILLAFFVYQSWALSPQRVSKSMMEKFLEVKTYHYLGSLTMEGRMQNAPASVKITVDADTDVSSKEDPKSSAVVSGLFNTQGIQVSASANMRAFKDNMYFQLVEFPSMFGQMKLPVNIEQFLKKWIKMPVSKQPEEAQSKDTRGAVQEELRNWVKEGKLFSKIEKLKDEEVSGRKCFHYEVTLNKGALYDLIQRLNKASGGKASPENLAKIKEELDKLKDLIGEIWIGKSDRHLYRFKTSAEITTEKIPEKLNLTADISFSNYNKKMDITEPEGAVDLQEIMKGVMPQIPQPSITP